MLVIPEGGTYCSMTKTVIVIFGMDYPYCGSYLKCHIGSTGGLVQSHEYSTSRVVPQREREHGDQVEGIQWHQMKL